MNNENNIIQLSDYITPAYKKPNIFIKRLSAFSIDIALIAMIKVVLTVTFFGFIDVSLGHLPEIHKLDLEYNLSVADFIVTMLIYGGYFFINHLMLGHQTIGKKIMGLNVVSSQFKNTADKNFFELTMRQIALRSISYFVGYMSFGIAFTLPLFNKSQKNITDYISQTEVVSNEELYHLLKPQSADVIQIDVDSMEKAA
jgi:uncharacterized RDD family membrane protein YckC